MSVVKRIFNWIRPQPTKTTKNRFLAMTKQKLARIKIEQKLDITPEARDQISDIISLSELKNIVALELSRAERPGLSLIELATARSIVIWQVRISKEEKVTAAEEKYEPDPMDRENAQYGKTLYLDAQREVSITGQAIVRVLTSKSPLKPQNIELDYSFPVERSFSKGWSE